MLQKIIQFSVRNKLIIGLATLFLLGVGIYQTTKLPIDAVPDITNNQVVVITSAPSFGATDIERLITFPIEQANSNIAGIEEIRSFSRFGLSLVTIVFSESTDIYWARQQVAERLTLVKSQIPENIGKPELGPITTGLGEIYQYVVKAKKGFENKYSLTDLRTIQDWVVRRQLLGVNGVAEVSSFGGKLKQYQIAINPNKLHANNITVQQVFDAVNNGNENTGGTYIEKGPQVLFIRTEGLISNVADIENIVIKQTKSSMPLKIKDVASVETSYATRFGALTYNGEGEVAGAIVMMLKGENSNKVIKNVKERIEQIKKTLPEGIEIEAFLDRTKMVNNAIKTVETNLIEGALIVILVLVFFLGNLRAGLLVASVIPLSMLFAIIMMNAFGVSGNLMSLGALDFGLIVDGAVIIVEFVMHKLYTKNNKQTTSLISQAQMNEVVEVASNKMMKSAVFGQLIILIVYLPIFTLHGIEGKMFKPMAQTVMFALIGAFILSVTYIPMMSSLVLSKKIKSQQDFSFKILQKLTSFYQRILGKALIHSKKIIGATVALFIISIAVLSRMGGEFIPVLEEGDFAVETRVLTGSNLSTTIDYCLKGADILKSRFPEVEKVVTKIGSGEVPTDPMPIEAADMMVILKDKKYWKSAKSFNELAAKMTEALEDVPGLNVSFQFPVQMRFNELMTGAKQQVVCKIFGENLDSLALKADELGKLVSKIKGSKEVFVETVTGISQIIVQYNRAIMAQYNIQIHDVNTLINTAFAGQSAGLLFEDEKRFDIVVKLNTNQRKSIDDVRSLLVPLANGEQIPLQQLASIEEIEGPNQIQREDAKRRITVGFNVDDRDIESIVEELKINVEKNLKLPAGYYITYGGSFENLQKAKESLSFAVPIALLLIFVLLFFSFKSIKLSLLIYVTIPLSAIGGILLLAARGMPFSVSAGIGFIALFGVAVLNGIVLVTEFINLLKEKTFDLKNTILQAGVNRLRPVLMTATVASLGFIPMALSNGAGAEVQRPLATVVIGGLIFATLLTLFVLPVLFYWMMQTKKPQIPKQVITIILLILISNFSSSAQTTISLKNAIDSAIQNNFIQKNEQQRIEYANALIASYKTIAPTNFTTEIGQYNSIFFDTRIGVSQNFILPKVHQANKSLLEQQHILAIKQAGITKLNLNLSIKECVAQYNYLIHKKQTLLEIDSLLSNAVNKAKNRFKIGETNTLELSVLEAQLTNIKAELLLQETNINNNIIQFNYLLQTEKKYLPELFENYLYDIKNTTQALSPNHPLLEYYNQQINLANAQTLVETKKLSPEISLGYSNTSIRGIGSDDKFYNGLYRFQSIQAGVALPLFNKSIKAKIAASKLQEKIANSNFDIEKKQIENEIQKTVAIQLKNKNTINLYNQKLLPINNTIIKTAIAQYNLGEINYIQFTTIINDALHTILKYSDAVFEANKNNIQLDYLLNHQ
jgi:heavy metal efflux system protein